MKHAQPGRRRDVPPHLRKYQERRKADTAKVVASAIEHLRERGRSVSLASIRDAAMQVPEGRRLSENTIVKNPGAYELYKAARKPQATHKAAATRWLIRDLPENERAAAKDIVDALRRKSKSDLVLLGWTNAQQIRSLQAQIKTLRAATLDAVVPASVKVLKPIGRR